MIDILQEFKDDYYSSIEDGKKYLKDKNICIIGLTRDTGNLLEKNIEHINKLSSYADVQYYIYENDSVDDTKIVLKNLSQKYQKFYYSAENLDLKKFGTTKENERTNALATHRNNCLEYVKNHFLDTDYTMVIDFDHRFMSLDGLLHSFGLLAKSEIDAIAGFSYEIKHNNGIDFLWNYDCWAYRPTWWTDLQLYGNNLQKDKMLWFGFYSPPVGSKPISVNSAFGGCCIYKTNVFVRGTYVGGDCEHVTFHKSLYSKNSEFNIVANPSQIMVF